jgi:hypothetical protein
MREAALVLALLGTGCACLCDTDAAVRGRAGDGAVDCGLVPFGADTTSAFDCVDAAIAAGRGAYVGWRRRGRDTELRTYLAGHDGSFALFTYDGGLSGECPTLTVLPCTDMPVRSTDATGMLVMTCTTTTDHVVCDH